MKGVSAKLEVIGDGPLRKEAVKKISQHKISNVRLLGYLSENGLFNKVKESCAAIIPSEWYENNPISVLEAFALGMPVIGSRIGGIPELIKDKETGLLFEPGNAEDLRSKIKYLLASPDKAAQMGKNARALVEKEYNPERHYEKLIEIYHKVIKAKDESYKSGKR